MENKSCAYEVIHIYNALQEWNLSRMHNFLSFLNEDGLLTLMNDKNLGKVGFNYFRKQKFLRNKIG